MKTDRYLPSNAPEGAPEVFRDSNWKDDGLDGCVLRMRSGGVIECHYSEIKKGDVFLQLPLLYWEGRGEGKDFGQWARAKADAKVFKDEGNSWGHWGIEAEKIRGYPAGLSRWPS